MWRSLLQSWIEQQARAKIYEKLAEKSGQPGEQVSEETGLASPPPPADVGLVFALAIEAGGLEDLLESVVVTRAPSLVVRQGTLKTRSIVIVESGMGREAATRGTEALVAGHRPAWVISAGFAGALVPQLARNDIVMVDSVVDMSGQRLSLDLKVSPEALAGLRGVHVGRLLTVDQIIAKPEEKRALAEAHGAIAVDMESSAVAEVCRQQKIKFMAVRVISDTLDEELPPEISQLAQQTSFAGKLGAVTGALWRRPSSVKDMLKLKEQALLATDRLAKFLVGVIEQLSVGSRQ
jgi:adenosylhomocysteine nucleosidase